MFTATLKTGFNNVILALAQNRLQITLAYSVADPCESL